MFNNLQEIEEFWNSHEFTKFNQDFKEINNLEVNIKNRSYLPVTLSMYEKIEKIAIAKNITVDRLIQRWLEEKLAEF